MSETNEDFKSPTLRKELINGTVEEWFEDVLGRRFKCRSCGESFEVREKHIGLSSGGNSPRIIDSLKSSILGTNPYDVSEDTIKNGLFKRDGTMVQGYIRCPYCNRDCGHHTEYLQNELVQPPNSDHMERTGGK